MNQAGEFNNPNKATSRIAMWSRGLIEALTPVHLAHRMRMKD
jgi:hypothetical protein